MFGISAFAQSPFASLGTNAYQLSITENFAIVDNISTGAQLFEGITEAITMADTNTNTWAFLDSIAESIAMAE